MGKWYWIWSIKRWIVTIMIGVYGVKNFINLLYRLTSQKVYIGYGVALISDILRLRPVRELIFFAPIAYVCVCIIEQILLTIEDIKCIKRQNRTKRILNMYDELTK